MRVETKPAKADVRKESGNRPDPAPKPRASHAPALTLIARMPPPGAALNANRNRPFILQIGKHLRGVFDRLIASSSLVSNAPVLDVRDFAWTALLRAEWQAIRDEAVAVARLDTEVDRRRCFVLWGYSVPIEDNIAECPRTAAIIAQIPGLNSAFFSIVAPGTHIPEHRGMTKGLITCHLGLIVPRDGDARMRVGNRIVRWAEGETLVFDDTYSHEVWNDTSSTRVLLRVQFEGPLRNPGKWVADVFLQLLRRSAFVRESRGNIGIFSQAIRQMDI
ncbi:MAG: aspartyl/asparaginyl beta-hydroxylase domain-containing protein [Sphingomonas sp.]